MVSRELAVILICPEGHREVTLKAHWQPSGLSGKCGRCSQGLKVLREGMVRLRGWKVRGYTRAEPNRPPTLCTICQAPLTEHRPYWRHPT